MELGVRGASGRGPRSRQSEWAAVDGQRVGHFAWGDTVHAVDRSIRARQPKPHTGIWECCYATVGMGRVSWVPDTPACGCIWFHVGCTAVACCDVLVGSWRLVGPTRDAAEALSVRVIIACLVHRLKMGDWSHGRI